jgi:transmembrane sensor
MVMTNLDRDTASASRAATHWLIALQESPDDADLRAAFEQWRKASPEHALAWEENEQLGGLLAEAQILRGDTKPRFRRRTVVAAAGLALAACIALILLPGPLVRWTADAATSTAELRTISLPDGSTATLGPESAIDIAFDDRYRRVRLVAGRAFFNVAHDTAKPFVVSAKQVDTTVTGTAFDVRLAGGDVEVGVQQGHVRVEDSSAVPPVHELLTSGDWVQVGDNGAVVRLRRPGTQVTAWQQGQLVAIDRPVADVVEELRAYYGGRIVLLDSTLAAKRVTGVYDLKDPAAGLRALATAHGAHVTALSDWILVLSGG